MHAAQLLVPVFSLNTRLWGHCLQDVADEQAWRRPNAQTNSLGFVALHVVDARFYTVSALGREVDNPYAESLADVRGIDDLEEALRPALDELRASWQAASEALMVALETVDADALDQPPPARFPIDDPTVRGMLLFLMQHESYHIGQMSLLRKHAGLPAMRYR